MPVPMGKKLPKSKTKTHLSADVGNIRMKWKLGALAVEVHNGLAWREVFGGSARLLLAAIFRLGNAVAELERRLGGHDYMPPLPPDDDFSLDESALKSFERHVAEARQESARRKPAARRMSAKAQADARRRYAD